MRIVLLGPPGAGKGTQASKIAANLGAKHLATGDILRAEAAAGTTLGKSAKSYMDRGDLVPDKVIIGMIRSRLSDGGGMVLDGFPRTVAQAQALDQELTKTKAPLDLALYLDVDREELVSRLSNRAVCAGCSKPFTLDDATERPKDVCDNCGGELQVREDDRPQAVRHRLRVYEEQTLPVLGYYKSSGRVAEVDGVGSTEEVGERLEAAIKQQSPV